MNHRLRILILGVSVLLAGCSAPASTEPAENEMRGVTNEVAFLWKQPFANLSVEFYLAPGLGPSQLAVEALVVGLENLTLKNVSGVDTFGLTGWAAEERSWTVEDLRRVALEHSRHKLSLTEYGANGSAVLHVYYLKGQYTPPTGGYARGGGSDGRAFVFFNDTNPVWARPLVEQKVERHVLLHEAGHALGLVNCDLPMVHAHEDPERRCHSTNTESVMAGGEVTIWPPDPTRVQDDRVFVYTFGEDDIADVRAFQALEPAGP